jgi:hypothetical protein
MIDEMFMLEHSIIGMSVNGKVAVIMNINQIDEAIIIYNANKKNGWQM